ncbi:uncharacterized protein G2W53_043456 [Senna tora]|uniref:Uncharacterized protein n=1 Tax=Senna tora TaxID=362788 RepID=A0A834SL79_9FABA|nr:uncharacterized protein G2W53_043456 [Senna tora]
MQSHFTSVKLCEKTKLSLAFFQSQPSNSLFSLHRIPPLAPHRLSLTAPSLFSSPHSPSENTTTVVSLVVADLRAWWRQI